VSRRAPIPCRDIFVATIVLIRHRRHLPRRLRRPARIATTPARDAAAPRRACRRQCSGRAAAACPASCPVPTGSRTTRWRPRAMCGQRVRMWSFLVTRSRSGGLRHRSRTVIWSPEASMAGLRMRTRVLRAPFRQTGIVCAAVAHRKRTRQLRRESLVVLDKPKSIIHH
jgi:hypothetical protein